MYIGVNLFGPRKPHNEEVEMAIRGYHCKGPIYIAKGFFKHV